MILVSLAYWKNCWFDVVVGSSLEVCMSWMIRVVPAVISMFPHVPLNFQIFVEGDRFQSRIVIPDEDEVVFLFAEKETLTCTKDGKMNFSAKYSIPTALNQKTKLTEKGELDVQMDIELKHGF